jgi:type I restriction enzyme M protein
LFAFRTENSLTADVFNPEGYDLILTNPPFKKGGIRDSENADLLAAFRSDLDNGKPGMAGDKLLLGAKPDSNGPDTVAM